MVCIKQSDFYEFKKRCSYLYHIRTEDNRLATYTPNEAQQILSNIRQEEFERSKVMKGVEQCKILLLKSRQIGGTTDTAMFNLDTMLNVPLAYGLVLAHDDKSTSIIYEKYRIAYNELPDIVEIVDDNGNRMGDGIFYEVKPKTESFTGFRLQFENKTKSRLLVRTAGAGDNVGRGDTLNFVHLSEGASYQHFNDVLTSINQALPRSAFVYSVIESTANGISGIGEGYYNLWTKSTNEWNRFQSGKTETFEGYRPVFISWYQLGKYRHSLHNGKLIDIEGVNFGSPESKKQFFDVEEQIVEELFSGRKEEGLEAINWYRWCLKENCNYDYTKAKREYPTFPEDAFLSTDSCFFDTGKLFSVLQSYEKKEPEYENGYLDYGEDGDFVFLPDKYGDLRIWEHPDRRYMNRYVVSCDPSYGVEGGDFSCMFVFDRLEQKFVAKWYGNLKEDLVAEELLKLAYYYNEALIIPEMNLNTIITLIQPDGIMPYTGQIYTRLIKSRSGVEEYGFHTLGNTRKLLLDTYNSWLREDYFTIPDLDALREHMNFVKKKSGNLPKYEAAEGKHDDQIIAMALCIYGSQWWEEEVWELNEDKTDVSNVFKINTYRTHKANLRTSQLGSIFRDVSLENVKAKKFKNLGNKT